jgi:hypothetical protein
MNLKHYAKHDNVFQLAANLATYFVSAFIMDLTFQGAAHGAKSIVLKVSPCINLLPGS